MTRRHMGCSGPFILYGPFGSDSTSNSFDQRVGASEDALAVGPGSTGAKDDAQAASGQGTTGKDEAVVLGGYGNRNVIGNDASQGNGVINNGALAIGGYGNNLTNSDIKVGYDAGDFQTALQTVGSNVSSAIQSNQASSQQTLDAVLGQLSDLAESKQTDGESGQNKIVLYVVLGVLAVVAWIFYKK